jgi:hypothetical protein
LTGTAPLRTAALPFIALECSWSDALRDSSEIRRAAARLA